MRAWPRLALICALLLSAAAAACDVEGQSAPGGVATEQSRGPAHFELSEDPATRTPTATPTFDPRWPTPPGPPIPTAAPPSTPRPRVRPTPIPLPTETLVAERVIGVDRSLSELSAGFETVFTWRSGFAGGFTAIAMAELGGSDFMYAASGSEIWLIDASDPADLKPLRAVASTSHEEVRELVFADGYLGMWAETEASISDVIVYRAADDGSLGAVLTASGKVQAIDIADGMAFVIDEEAGLFIFDLEARGGPALLSKTPGWSPLNYMPRGGRERAYFSLYDVAVQREYAYVAGVDSGFGVLDISDPSNPELVAQLDVPVSRVAVDGDVAYATVDRERLYAIDIASPSSPEVISAAGADLGSSLSGSRLNGVVITESGVAVLVTHSHHISLWHLQVFELTEDRRLVSTGQAASKDHAYALAEHDGGLFVGSYVAITSVEPSALPQEPVPASTSLPPGISGVFNTGDRGVVTFEGGYMVVAQPHGVQVVDTSTGQEVKDAFLPLWGTGTVLSETGEISIVESNETAWELDLSDPLQPALGDSFDWSSGYRQLDCSGIVVRETCYDTTRVNESESLHISVNDSYIEFGNGEFGFTGEPDTYYLLDGSLAAGGTRIMLNGETLYAISNGNLYVIDVSDPLNPVLRIRLTGLEAEHSQGSYSRLIQVGDVLYVFDSSLWAIDVSDPRNPEPIAYHETDAMSIFIDDGNIALVSIGGQVEVLRLVR